MIDGYLLHRTELAENYLSSLGFVDFRVRTVGEIAKIQIKEKQLPLLIESRKNGIKQILQGVKSSEISVKDALLKIKEKPF
ncbi:MAG: hypothetical protein K2O16_03930 [Lachnospiraceae bacterium]|nr:hypothetical protein [Lachnospiraceae bacterium]